MSRATLSARISLGRVGLIGLCAMLAMILAACGGGGGGGEGGPHVLHVLLVNHSKQDANITYSGGEALSSSEDKLPVPSCRAGVIDYPLKDPFTLSVNDKVAVDSATVTGGVPNNGESDVVVEVDLAADGSLTNPLIRAGSRISKPATLGICL